MSLRRACTPSLPVVKPSAPRRVFSLALGSGSLRKAPQDPCGRDGRVVAFHGCEEARDKRRKRARSPAEASPANPQPFPKDRRRRRPRRRAREHERAIFGRRCRPSKPVQQFVPSGRARRLGGDVPQAPERAPAGPSNVILRCFHNGSRMGASGVGFVLTRADGLAVIDLDKPVTPAQQQLHGDICSRFAGTYQEISLSGNGVHIYMYGDVPGGGRRMDNHKVECYSARRFIIVTGTHVQGTAKLITDQSSELARLLDELRPPERPKARVGATKSDTELLQLVFRSQRMVGVYRGAWERYASRSDADFALCREFSRYTREVAQIARLFMASPLGERSKVQDRKDYALRTALRAVGG